MSSQESTLVKQPDGAIIGPLKRKRGRPKVSPYGNTSAKAQKNVYLSEDAREMLMQLRIVLALNDTDAVENAVRREFMFQFKKITSTYGKTFWIRALERVGHIDKLGVT